MRISPHAPAMRQDTTEREYAEAYCDDAREETVALARAAYAFREHIWAFYNDSRIAAVKDAALSALYAFDDWADEHLACAAIAIETHAFNEAGRNIEGKVQDAVTLAYADPTPDKEDVQ